MVMTLLRRYYWLFEANAESRVEEVIDDVHLTPTVGADAGSSLDFIYLKALLERLCCTLTEVMANAISICDPFEGAKDHQGPPTGEMEALEQTLFAPITRLNTAECNFEHPPEVRGLLTTLDPTPCRLDAPPSPIQTTPLPQQGTPPPISALTVTTSYCLHFTTLTYFSSLSCLRFKPAYCSTSVTFPSPPIALFTGQVRRYAGVRLGVWYVISNPFPSFAAS
ncbi:unnamed protein product [Hydatigera taeniaeformis]|uniref:Uncharacterized protein n=1 Tax=Hydatigena taeniaeformis TaxID=6205 RepID=A0A0R3XD35_HYDTA|nr:unnamed protein product [Hydatigera taeniaeformis]